MSMNDVLPDSTCRCGNDTCVINHHCKRWLHNSTGNRYSRSCCSTDDYRYFLCNYNGFTEENPEIVIKSLKDIIAKKDVEIDKLKSELNKYSKVVDNPLEYDKLVEPEDNTWTAEGVDDDCTIRLKGDK